MDAETRQSLAEIRDMIASAHGKIEKRFDHGDMRFARLEAAITGTVDGEPGIHHRIHAVDAKSQAAIAEVDSKIEEIAAKQAAEDARRRWAFGIIGAGFLTLIGERLVALAQWVIGTHAPPPSP